VISDQESTIRLGTGPVWTSTVVPAALPRFHRRFPRHRVMIQTGSVDRMIEDLRLGRIEVFAGALIRQNQFPGFVREPLTKARMGIMCSNEHPLAQIDGPIDPGKVVEYPFVSFVATTDIMEILGNYLKSVDAPPPRNMIETSSIYACVELVRSGGYLFFESAMIANSSIGAGLKVLDLGHMIHEFDMGFVYRKGLDRLPPYNGIMRAMKDVLAEHVSPPPEVADTVP
jgi:DNA-binding transcriptional LysR family regulator